MKNKLFYKGELLTELHYQNGILYCTKEHKQDAKANLKGFNSMDELCDENYIICQSSELNIENMPYVSFESDEVEKLAEKKYPSWSSEYDIGMSYRGFIEGYQAHSKTHSLSDDEVVEFAEWIRIKDITLGLHYFYLDGDEYSEKELIQLFKDQQSREWEVVIDVWNSKGVTSISNYQPQTHTKEGKVFLTIKEK
jgi:hypothetical protein